MSYPRSGRSNSSGITIIHIIDFGANRLREIISVTKPFPDAIECNLTKLIIRGSYPSVLYMYIKRIFGGAINNQPFNFSGSDSPMHAGFVGFWEFSGDAPSACCGIDRIVKN